MESNIHICGMRLSLVDNKYLWLIDNEDNGMELTPKQLGELEQLLQEFFEKHFLRERE